MKNYTLYEAKSTDQWSENTVEVPQHDISLPGKFFLKKPLGLSSCEMSLNALKPGQGTPFCHAHVQNEEIYLFISGAGEFQVDDDVFPIKSGTTIKVEPDGVRAWRNTGQSDLVFVVIQAAKDSLKQHTLDDVNLPERKPAWV